MYTGDINDPLHLFLNAAYTTSLIVGAWLVKKVGDKLLSKKDPSTAVVLREAGEIGVRIRIKLAELGTRMHASRTYLVQYHNGQRYVSGSKLMKQSMTHEWTYDQIRPVSRQHQDTLITWVVDECKLIEEPGPSFHYTNEMPEGTFRTILESEGVQAVARCAVLHRGEIVGFLGVDFLERPKGPPERIAELPLFAVRIEQILNDESRGRYDNYGGHDWS